MLSNSWEFRILFLVKVFRYNEQLINKNIIQTICNSQTLTNITFIHFSLVFQFPNYFYNYYLHRKWHVRNNRLMLRQSISFIALSLCSSVSLKNKFQMTYESQKKSKKKTLLIDANLKLYFCELAFMTRTRRLSYVEQITYNWFNTYYINTNSTNFQVLCKKFFLFFDMNFLISSSTFNNLKLSFLTK